MAATNGGCSLCGGTGWKPVSTTTSHGGKSTRRVPCDCLSSEDREELIRKDKEAAAEWLSGHVFDLGGRAVAGTFAEIVDFFGRDWLGRELDSFVGYISKQGRARTKSAQKLTKSFLRADHPVIDWIRPFEPTVLDEQGVRIDHLIGLDDLEGRKACLAELGLVLRALREELDQDSGGHRGNYLRRLKANFEKGTNRESVFLDAFNELASAFRWKLAGGDVRFNPESPKTPTSDLFVSIDDHELLVECTRIHSRWTLQDAAGRELLRRVHNELLRQGLSISLEIELHRPLGFAQLGGVEKEIKNCLGAARDGTCTLAAVPGSVSWRRLGSTLLSVPVSLVGQVQDLSDRGFHHISYSAKGATAGLVAGSEGMPIAPFVLGVKLAKIDLPARRVAQVIKDKVRQLGRKNGAIIVDIGFFPKREGGILQQAFIPPLEPILKAATNVILVGFSFRSFELVSDNLYTELNNVVLPLPVWREGQPRIPIPNLNYTLRFPADAAASAHDLFASVMRRNSLGTAYGQ